MFEKQGRFTRGCSILLSGAMLLSSLSLADYAHASAFAPQTPELIERLALPADLGMVTDTNLTPASSTRPLVVMIQDLHLHYPTQKRIVKILDQLYSKNIVSGPLGMEGAEGLFDTSKLASYPAGPIKEELVDYFMKKGELSGDEAYSVLRGDGHLLYGIDNAEYYGLNRDLFKATLANRNELEAQLDRVQAGLDLLKRQHSSSALRRLYKEESYSMASAEALLQKKLAAAKDPLTKNIVTADHMLSLLHKLVRQQVTLDEARYVAQRLPAFVSLTKDLLKTDTEETIKSAVDFYLVALMRNLPMAEHTLALLKQSKAPAPAMAIVAGGFHTAGLIREFKKAGVNYIVITPTVKEMPDAAYHELYEKRLCGERLTWEEVAADYRLSPEKSSALPASATDEEENMVAVTTSLNDREVRHSVPLFSPLAQYLEERNSVRSWFGFGHQQLHVVRAAARLLNQSGGFNRRGFLSLPRLFKNGQPPQGRFWDFARWLLSWMDVPNNMSNPQNAGQRGSWSEKSTTGGSGIPSATAEAERQRFDTVVSQWSDLKVRLEEGVSAYVDSKRREGVFTDDKAQALLKKTVDQVERWVLSPSIDRITRQGIINAINEGRWQDLVTAHSGQLQFGTAGPRSVAAITPGELQNLESEGFGAPILKGPNTVNNNTLARLTMGVALHFKRVQEAKDPSQRAKVSITWDSRVHGRGFADLVTAIFLKEGLDVYLFDVSSPMPVMSYSVAEFKLDLGILISASHNPQEFNGYKVSNPTGAQLNPALRKAIELAIYGNEKLHIPPVTTLDDVAWAVKASANLEDHGVYKTLKPRELGPLARAQWEARGRTGLTFLSDFQRDATDAEPPVVDVHNRHRNHTLSLLLWALDHVREQLADMVAWYSPMYGNGTNTYRRLIEEPGQGLGLDTLTVDEFARLDGLFPKLAAKGLIPDPGNSAGHAKAWGVVIEELQDQLGSPDAMKQALQKLGEKKGIILGTDPDADRLGVAVPIPEDQLPTEQAIQDKQLVFYIVPPEWRAEVGFAALRLLPANDTWAMITKYRIDRLAEILTTEQKENLHFSIIKTHVTTDQIKVLKEYAESLGFKHVEIVEPFVGFSLVADSIVEGWKRGVINISGQEESGGFSVGGAPPIVYTLLHLFQKDNRLDVRIQGKTIIQENANHDPLLSTEAESYYGYSIQEVQETLSYLERNKVLIQSGDSFHLAQEYQGLDHDAFWNKIDPPQDFSGVQLTEDEGLGYWKYLRGEQGGFVPDTMKRNSADLIPGAPGSRLGKKGHTMEKDGLMALTLIAEIAAYARSQAQTLNQYLWDQLYKVVGYFATTNQSKAFPFNEAGAAQKVSYLKSVLNNARQVAQGEPLIIAGKTVTRVTIFIPKKPENQKYANPKDFPVSEFQDLIPLLSEADHFRDHPEDLLSFFPEEGVRFYFTDGSHLTVRPSGTEPKLRFYVQWLASDIAGDMSDVERYRSADVTAYDIAEAAKKVFEPSATTIQESPPVAQTRRIVVASELVSDQQSFDAMEKALSQVLKPHDGVVFVGNPTEAMGHLAALLHREVALAPVRLHKPQRGDIVLVKKDGAIPVNHLTQNGDLELMPRIISANDAADSKKIADLITAPAGTPVTVNLVNEPTQRAVGAFDRRPVVTVHINTVNGLFDALHVPENQRSEYSVRVSGRLFHPTRWDEAIADIGNTPISIWNPVVGGSDRNQKIAELRQQVDFVDHQPELVDALKILSLAKALLLVGPNVQDSGLALKNAREFFGYQDNAGVHLRQAIEHFDAIDGTSVTDAALKGLATGKSTTAWMVAKLPWAPTWMVNVLAATLGIIHRNEVGMVFNVFDSTRIRREHPEHPGLSLAAFWAMRLVTVAGFVAPLFQQSGSPAHMALAMAAGAVLSYLGTHLAINLAFISLTLAARAAAPLFDREISPASIGLMAGGLAGSAALLAQSAHGLTVEGALMSVLYAAAAWVMTQTLLHFKNQELVRQEANALAAPRGPLANADLSLIPTERLAAAPSRNLLDGLHVMFSKMTGPDRDKARDGLQKASEELVETGA